MVNRSLTEGSIAKGIFTFSLPVVFTNVLQVLFNMSDLAVVGRFAGAAALGSVGCTVLLVSLFSGFVIGIGSGVNALAAQCIGAGDRDKTNKTVCTAAVIGLCTGIVICLAGIVLCKPILILMGTKEELLPDAVLYMRLYFLGMPAMGLFNFANGTLSAHGETKWPLYILSGAGVLNVCLNLLFVISFDMGVRGVAIASVLSQCMAAALVLFFLWRNRHFYGLEFRLSYVSRERCGAVLSISLPAGLQNAIFMLANLFIQSGVNSFSAVVVEGNSAAQNSDALVYDVMAAFYVGCQSYVAQNYGAKKWDRVKRAYILGIVYSFVAALILGIGFRIAGVGFIGIFTSDPEVAAAGLPRLRVMSWSYCISAFMDNTISASRGLGKTFWPTLLVIFGSCVFRVVWIYTVFAHFHTITSLYLLYAFSWTITSLTEIAYFLHIYKKLKKQSLFTEEKTGCENPQAGGCHEV